MSIVGDVLNNTYRPVRVLLLVQAPTTGYLSFRGWSFDAEVFSDHALALVFAVVIGVIIWGGWTVAFATMLQRMTTGARLGSLGVLAAFMAAVGYFSCVPNVIAMTGESAAIMHLHRSVRPVETALASRLADLRAAQALIPDLRTEADKFFDAHTDEYEFGAYSGIPGDGAVEGAQLAISEALAALADAAERDLGAARAHADIVSERIDGLRSVIDDGAPYPERLDRYARVFDEARLGLAEMSPAGILDRLDRVLARLPQEIDSRERYSANPQTEAKQRAAIARLRADLDGTTRSLRAASAAVAGEAETALPYFERKSAFGLITAYWTEYAHFIVAGFGVDYAPAVVLFLLMIAASGKTSEELATDAILTKSVGEILIANMALAGLRKQGSHEEAVRMMQAMIRGEQTHMRDRDGEDEET